MMAKSIIPRTALSHLEEWFKKENRKPLLIRGARQTGTTTLVTLFSNRFKQFLFFNLENPRDRSLFDMELPFQETPQTLFFERNSNFHEPSTLIFIDEIQNSPYAVALLRFFAEEAPHLPVVAAGSLLEVYLEKQNISFPVGRVEYLFLQPVTFSEFLHAFEQIESEQPDLEGKVVEGAGWVKTFKTVPLPPLFRRYNSGVYEN